MATVGVKGLIIVVLPKRLQTIPEIHYV